MCIKPAECIVVRLSVEDWTSENVKKTTTFNSNFSLHCNMYSHLDNWQPGSGDTELFVSGSGSFS